MAASLELDEVALPDLVRAVDDIFVVLQSVDRLITSKSAKASEHVRVAKLEWITDWSSDKTRWLRLIERVADFLRGFIVLDCLSKGQSISLRSDNFLVLEVGAVPAAASNTLEV